MRLTEQQLAVIRERVARHLGAEASLWLFGSRADDRRRGGDIDLYVELDDRKPLRQILSCKLDLEERLDLRVDLLVKNRGEDKPIFNIAKATGVRL